MAECAMISSASVSSMKAFSPFFTVADDPTKEQASQA